MVHIKRRIGQKKNQIHEDDIAQNNKPGNRCHTCTGCAAHLKSLQWHEKQKHREREVSPGWKQNILPAYDAYEFLPQPIPPPADSPPYRQREKIWVLPHIKKLPQRVEMLGRMVSFLLQAPSSYLG
jgi:hypothetical protein